MQAALLQIVTAAIGTLGFSIYFRVSEKNVVASTAGGAIGWAVYLLLYHLTGSLFFASFTAALLVYLFAEVMARVLKAPSNIFLIPGIIPLLPGGTLYYTMYGLVSSDRALFADNGAKTAVVTLAIAVGIVVGAVLTAYALRLFAKLQKRKK